jgi:hypothetical protein
MNRVAPEIAIKISVFFQHNYRYAGAREQIASHHPRRSAADDHAPSLQRLRHKYTDSTDHAYLMMSFYRSVLSVITTNHRRSKN